MTSTTTKTPSGQKESTATSVITKQTSESTATPVGLLALGAALLGGAALVLFTGEPAVDPEPEKSPLDEDDLATLTEQQLEFLDKFKKALLARMIWWIAYIHQPLNILEKRDEAKTHLQKIMWKAKDAHVDEPNLMPYIDKVMTEMDLILHRLHEIKNIQPQIHAFDSIEWNGLKGTSFGLDLAPECSFDAHDLYNQKKYWEAAVQFMHAYLERPHASFLWNIGKCWEGMGYSKGEPEYFFNAAEHYKYQDKTKRIANVGLSIKKVTKTDSVNATALRFTFETEKPNSYPYEFQITVDANPLDPQRTKYRLSNFGRTFNTRDELAVAIYDIYLIRPGMSVEIAAKHAGLSNTEYHILAQVLANRVFLEMGWT